MDDDDDLVLAVLRGDPKAWNVLGPRLRAAIRPCFRPHFGEADADDLVQRTLLIIHRKLPEFEVRAGKPLRKWARVIARSQFQDEIRRRKRRERLVDQFAQIPRTPLTNLGSGLAKAERRAAELELMHEALERIDSPYRRVLQHDLQGGNIDEFARREGIKRGSVRTRRRRGLKMLREIVRELGGAASTPPNA